MSGITNKLFITGLLAMATVGWGQGARAYFSSKADGSDTTTLYEGLETLLYLVVEAPELPPGIHAKADLVAGRSGPENISDMETVVLTRMDGHRYAAAIQVDRKPGFAPGDGKLNLEFGDVVTGTYQDPLSPEARAVANVEFGYYPSLGLTTGAH